MSAAVDEKSTEVLWPLVVIRSIVVIVWFVIDCSTVADEPVVVVFVCSTLVDVAIGTVVENV